MIGLSLTADEKRIAVEISPRASDQMKGVPGSKWDKNLHRWTLPKTLAALWQMRALFGQELQGTPELDAWASSRNQQRMNVLASKHTPPPRVLRAVSGFEDSGMVLRDYQKTAVGWMVTAGRGILADSMRVGKTPQSIMAARVLNELGADVFPALIVAPNSMKFIWAEEIQKWWPGVRVQVINGTAAIRKKQFQADADFFVINWDGLAGHSRLAPYGSVELTDRDRQEKEINELHPKLVILDEAHRMVNPKNKWTRAAWYVMHQAAYRFALTGTPVVNEPGDAWSILHGIDPDEWPVKTKFIDRYTISAVSGYGGLDVFGLNPGTQQEFYQILEPRFLRRTLHEVRPEIPDLLPPQVREVQMDAKQAKAYDDLIQHMMTETDGGLIVVESPLVKAGRLTQAAAATLTLDADGVVQLTTPSCKLNALLEVIEEAPGESLVVFAASRKLIDLTARFLATKKIMARQIVGGQDPEERARTIADFQAGLFQVILCTTGAGAEGITLNRADRLVFLQRDWSAVKMAQAAARIEGTLNPKQIIHIQTKGTIEAAVAATLDFKLEMLELIVRDHLRPGAKR